MNGLGHTLKTLNLIFGHSLKKMAIRFLAIRLPGVIICMIQNIGESGNGKESNQVEEKKTSNLN